MKKIFLILFSIILFANQNTSKPITIDGIVIYSLPKIEENTSENILTTEINETNQNVINETNTTFEEIFATMIKTIKPSIDIAVIIDKKLFKKFLPSIINSLNSYLIYKNIEYNLTVYDIQNIQEALTHHKEIIFYTYNPEEVRFLYQFNNNFYFPMLNRNETDINFSNFYFGGIDYLSQIKKLTDFVLDDKVYSINDNTLTSQKLFALESQFLNVIPYKYNNIYYKDLNTSYVFLNTSPQNSIQVLSNIYYKNIEPDLILTTQINYNPSLIALTQKEALNKLIITNSIINVPNELEDINLLLKTDIKFNWLNYSANILCNNIYNKYNGSDNYFMNDFMIYMFDNQINYKIKLYQVVFKAFKEIHFSP